MNIILTLPICSAGFSAWLSPIGTVPKDFNPEDGQISVYKFHYDPNILAYCFHTLQQYIGGVDFGIPGTPKADKIAIEKLLPNRLKDHFCFRTQDAVNHLEYIRSDRYGDVKL